MSTTIVSSREITDQDIARSARIFFMNVSREETLEIFIRDGHSQYNAFLIYSAGKLLCEMESRD